MLLMVTVTKEALTAYRARWASIADIEAQELCQMTPAQALQQLETLRQRARQLGILERVIEINAAEAAVVRRRWQVLKDAACA
jgi:hypothetical protein